VYIVLSSLEEEGRLTEGEKDCGLGKTEFLEDGKDRSGEEEGEYTGHGKANGMDGNMCAYRRGKLVKR
jgi:hypothetical protein